MWDSLAIIYECTGEDGTSLKRSLLSYWGI